VYTVAYFVVYCSTLLHMYYI